MMVRLRWVFLGAVVSFTLAAAQAQAQTTEETVCRAAISKHVRKFTSVVFRDLVVCHAKRSAGRIPATTDCNDVFTIPGNHSVAAYSKAFSAILASCPNDLAGVLAQYARCPSPHSNLDDDGATSGIDDFEEATGCVLNLAATMANAATATVLGHSASVPGSELSRCQGALGRDLRKRINTIGKVRHACQAAADAAAGGLDYTCAEFDDGKIAANLQAMANDIAKSCALPQDDLVPLGACGQTADQLTECVGGLSTRLGGGLAAVAYELPAACTLGHATLTLNAGSGKMRTSTAFEVGYNGLGMGTDLLDDFHGAVNLDCDPDCVDCVVTLDPLKDQPESYCRCDNDPTIHCDTVHGPDADDCGGGTCNCMFGPPLPLLSSGVAACVVNRFASDLQGLADGGTGVATTSINNLAIVHVGMTVMTPCPVCQEDVTPNDGVRDGACSGGSRDGLICDQNAVSPDFGPVSFDCPPSLGQNVSGQGLQVEFALTSVEAPTIGTDLSQNSVPVYCLQCSGNPLVGCSSDADCDALGVGTCSVNTSSQASANGCDDGICTSSSGPDSRGTCEANAADMFCDGIARQDGRGLLPCVSDADCTAYDPDCPGGDCGTCNLLQSRSCFPDPFGAVGSEAVAGAVPAGGVYGADMVGTMCVPATANPGINTSVGLPGPGRLLLNFDFLGRCASDHSVVFDLPGGSNCP